MSFLHPWMLLGMLAALIPLIVHLFDRRRARPVPFAAIAFVLRSQRRTASRLKLKRLLLYTLRTLILLAIPLALARPELRKAGANAAIVRGPAATAIILDASFGMRYENGRKTLFDAARDEAEDLLRSLNAEEPATVLVCTSSPLPPPAAGFDRTRLRGMLDEAKPSFGVADMSRCLELAAHALEESPLAGKRIYLVSAFFASGFHLESPPPLVTGPDQKKSRPEVILKDVSNDKLPNHAIVDVKADAAPQVGPHVFQFAVTLRNFSDQAAKDLQVSLQVSGQTVAKVFMDAPAQGTVQKTLTHRFDASGPTPVTLLAGPDDLAEDDRREILVQVPRPLRALVVNGSPSSVRYRDEAFFVDAALTAPGSPVQETVQDADVALKGDLSAYDVVALLNVSAPEDAEVQKLRAFVEHGGGLLISGGDHVEPDTYNARFGDLLPSPIRVVKSAVLPSDPDVDRRAERLKDMPEGRAIFAPFAGKAKEGLYGARFYRYLLLEAESAKTGASQTLAAFGDGAPALVSARRGRGRVLLFTSTLDRDWTDLPIRTAYLPLVQRFAAYLAGALDEHEALRPRVGQTATLKPDIGQKIAAVKAPSGEETPLKTLANGDVEVGPLPEPGLYQTLDGSNQPIPALGFGAALDPAASDLTTLKTEELAAYFGEESVKSLGGAQHEKIPIWTWLLVAAAIAFFLEGVLLRS